MSGHSQFANIKHRKDAQDKTRGKIFQKLNKEISAAVKLSGPNIDNNPKLRAVLEKARSLNMPKENITRAIKKASNQNDNSHYEEIIYEGYGPGTIAMIVHCLTDNKNRSGSNIRAYFNKYHGKLGTSNSVQYLFFKAGIIEFETKLTSDETLELVIDFDIIDLTKNDDIINLQVNVKDLINVVKVLSSAGIDGFITNEIRNIAFVPVKVENIEDNDLNLYQKLLDLLENDDDVQFVESNLKN